MNVLYHAQEYDAAIDYIAANNPHCPDRAWAKHALDLLLRSAAESEYTTFATAGFIVVHIVVHHKGEPVDIAVWPYFGEEYDYREFSE